MIEYNKNFDVNSIPQFFLKPQNISEDKYNFVTKKIIDSRFSKQNIAVSESDTNTIQ